MVLVFALIGAALACALLSAIRAYLRAQSTGERSLIFRLFLFAGLAALFCIALFAKAPPRFVLLAAAPLFFLTAVASRVFESARRRSRQPRVREINPPKH
jgi:hypothetical protein